MKVIRTDRKWAALSAMCALSVSILAGAAYASCGCAQVAYNPDPGYVATCFSDGTCQDQLTLQAGSCVQTTDQHSSCQVQSVRLDQITYSGQCCGRNPDCCPMTGTPVKNGMNVNQGVNGCGGC